MNPPPLFTWEVYPHVYPPPPVVRVPSRPLGRLAAVALGAVVVILVGVSVALIAGGAEALGSSSYELSGSVVTQGASVALPGATVEVVSENGWHVLQTTDSSGGFRFTGIPSGGATLNVTDPGYEPVSLVLFFSPAYRATGAGPGGLVVELANGSTTNLSTIYETAFPNLETFVSSLWSAGALLLIAASVAAAGAWMAFRERRPTVAVAGGLAGALAPTVLSLLGVFTAFPLALVPAAAAVGLGIVGATLELAPVLWAGRTPESA
jgi:hypothetical protein